MDHLDGLTQSAIKRILRKAGVKNASGTIFEETRGVFLTMMDPMLKRILLFVEHERRKTAMPSDIKRAIESIGLRLFTHDETVTRCTARQYPKRTRRTRRGTRALKNIGFYQRQSDCVYFTKTAFYRLVKEQVDIRFNKVALDQLQLFLEAHLVRVLKNANLAAIHASRITLMPKDVQLARRLSDHPLDRQI